MRWSLLKSLAVALLAISFPAPAISSEDAPLAEPHRSGQVYRLACPNGADVFRLPRGDGDWQTLHKMLDEKSRQLIQVVERSQVQEYTP